MTESQALAEHIKKRINITNAELDEILSCFKLMKVRKRQFIIQPGFIAHYKNYVIKGAFRAYVIDDTGQDHTIQVSIEDWWISDYNSYLYQKPATMFVEALEDSIILQIHYTHDGISWVDHADPPCATATDGAWQSVTWGATAPNGSGGQGLFVAVALSGNINDQVMTSPDAVNWTARTAAAANDWKSVAWSPSLNLFAAVAQSGSGNRVMTSHDGVSWTSRVSASDNNWQSVTWAPGPGLFVAVASNGSGNCVMTSSNGITWLSRTTPVPGINLSSVTWSPALNLFVAVGDTGTGNRVMTSPDGISWSFRTSAANNQWTSVTWGATAPNGTGGQGLFVAVSQTGTGNRVMTSPNGISWTSRTSAADYTWQSVAWSAELGLFVAVASSGTDYANPDISNFIMTSPDGITWTAKPDAINNFWTSLAWSPKLGLFAAVAYSSINPYSSSNIGDFIMTSIPVAPVITITNIAADSNSATISWTTNEEGSSQVIYGLTSGYGMSTTADTTLTFTHSMTITGLTCHTTYHFQVKSALAGLSALSSDSSFTTTYGSCYTPAITGPGNVCIGSSIILSDSLSGGRWSGSSALAIVDSVSGTVTGVNAGTSLISYSVAGHIVTHTVTVNPGISASAGVAICSGSGTAMSAAYGSSYTWSPITGLSASTGAAITASPTVTTTYTVTGISTFGCSNTATATVTVNPLPSISAGSGTAICLGQSAILTSGGGINYNWSPATGLSATTGATVNAAPAATTTYTVTGTNSAGCTNYAVVMLTVNPLPVITVSSGSAICIGGSTTLSATGGIIYGWSPSTGLSATTGTLITATPLATTNYTVTGTDANGCSGLSTRTVSVNPLPVVSAGAGSAICVGASATLSASGAGSYIWSPSVGLSSTTGSVVTALPGVTTTYTVTGTNGIGCSGISTVTVTVNTLPFIGAGSGVAVCNGTSAPLVATGGSTYRWLPATGLSATTGATITASPASTTSYTVTGTNTNGCTNNATVIVTVNPLPSVSAGPGVAICTGTSAILIAAGGSIYNWSPSTGLSATTGTTIIAGPLSTTTYTVTGTNGSGCTNNAMVVVTVNPLPVISAGAGIAVCSGSASSLTASGGITYNWLPGTGLSATSGTTVIAGPASTTTYTVSGTNSNGCSNTANVTVTVNPLPGIITGSDSLCQGMSTAMTDASPGGLWSSSNTLVGTISGSGIVSALSAGTTIISYSLSSTGCYRTHTVSVLSVPAITGVHNLCAGGDSMIINDAASSGTYTCSLAAVSNLGGGVGLVTTGLPGAATLTYTTPLGCSASAAFIINELPAAIAGGTASLCAGASVTLTDSSAGGVWSTASGIITIGSASGIVGGINTGTATVTYTITGTGCYRDTMLTVSGLPVPGIITGYDSVCAGISVLLYDSVAGGIWSCSGSGASVSGGLLTGISAGVDTVIYTVTNLCGDSSAKKIITINPLPATGVISGKDSFCVGDNVLFTESIIGGNWGVSNLLATISTAGLLSASDAGIDTVIYTVSNASCIASAIYPVYIWGAGYCPEVATTTVGSSFYEAVQIYPNPNSGDFKFKCSEAGLLSLYNLLGQKIQTYALKSGENTIQTGTDVPDGVYVVEFLSETGVYAQIQFVLAR